MRAGYGWKMVPPSFIYAWRYTIAPRFARDTRAFLYAAGHEADP